MPLSAIAAGITLKLGHIAPAGRSTHDIAAQKFALQVTANTSGRVSVKVFPHGQLGRPAEHWSQLSAGAMDLFVHDMTGSEMVEPKPKNSQNEGHVKKHSIKRVFISHAVEGKII